jgi:hypothetical protein
VKSDVEAVELVALFVLGPLVVFWVGSLLVGLVVHAVGAAQR